MIDLTKPLFALFPTAKWTLNGDTYAGLTWLSENVAKPSEQELLDWVDPNAYKAQRAAAYPSIPDQLDLLYHGGMDAWKAAITAVKTQFPKV